jgi:hypothetical protein
MSKYLKRTNVICFLVPLALFAAVNANAERMAFSYTFMDADVEFRPWNVGSVLFGTIDGTIDPNNPNRVIVNSFGQVLLKRPGLPLFIYPHIANDEFNTWPNVGEVPVMTFDGSEIDFRACPSGFTFDANGDGVVDDCPFAFAGGFLISTNAPFDPGSWATAADGSGDTVCQEDGQPGGPDAGCRVSDLPFVAANWSLEVLSPLPMVTSLADANGSGNKIRTLSFGSKTAKGATTVSDANGDQVPEFGVLVEGSLFASIKDVVNGTLLGRPKFNDNFDTVAFLSAGDADGDGEPDVAVVGRDAATGTVRAWVKDVASGSLVKSFTFPKDFEPFAAVAVDNVRETAAMEIAVLGIDGTGKVQATIKDALSGNLINKIQFNKKFTPLFFAAVPNASGKLKYLAVLGRDASGIIQAQVKRVGNGALVSNIRFSKSYDPKAFISFADSDGNGSGEIAVVGINDSGAVRAQIKEIADGAAVTTIKFSKAYPALDAIAINGVAGTGRNEIAVLGKNASDQHRLQIKDLLSGNLVKNIPVP